MNYHLIIFLLFFLVSCASTPPTSSSVESPAPPPYADSESSLAMAFLTVGEGVNEVGKNADLETAYIAGKNKVGPNPYPKSKHYHTELDIEHTHPNPSIKHVMNIPYAAIHLYEFDHPHNGKSHRHYVPLAFRHEHRNLNN